jgi:hypothetical protein
VADVELDEAASFASAENAMGGADGADVGVTVETAAPMTPFREQRQ